jgi:hypothetical protein
LEKIVTNVKLVIGILQAERDAKAAIVTQLDRQIRLAIHTQESVSANQALRVINVTSVRQIIMDSQWMDANHVSVI